MANSKNTKGRDWQKNIFARASRFFVQFLAVVARLRHEISRARFKELVSTTQTFSFSFLNLHTVFSDLTQKISPSFDK